MRLVDSDTIVTIISTKEVNVIDDVLLQKFISNILIRIKNDMKVIYKINFTLNNVNIITHSDSINIILHTIHFNLTKIISDRINCIVNINPSINDNFCINDKNKSKYNFDELMAKHKSKVIITQDYDAKNNNKLKLITDKIYLLNNLKASDIINNYNVLPSDQIVNRIKWNNVASTIIELINDK
jgi:hypothetical protein